MLSAGYITPSNSHQQETLLAHQTTGIAVRYNNLLLQTTSSFQHLTLQLLYQVPRLPQPPCPVKPTTESLLVTAPERMKKMTVNDVNYFTLTSKMMIEPGL